MLVSKCRTGHRLPFGWMKKKSKKIKWKFLQPLNNAGCPKMYWWSSYRCCWRRTMYNVDNTHVTIRVIPLISVLLRFRVKGNTTGVGTFVYDARGWVSPARHIIGYSPNSTWLVTLRFDMTRHVRHVVNVARVVTSVSNRADEEAMLACLSLVVCSLDLHQSREKLLEKWDGHMSTPVHVVATPLNACRDRRDERVAQCCPTSATRLVTSRHDFSLYQNAWAI